MNGGADRTAERPIVIAAAPFSGASVAAHGLYEAGLDLGGRMNPPDLSDAAGFFSDADFAEFHDKVLAENGGDPLDPSTLGSLRPGDELADTSARIIEGRQSTGRPWGWRDARTALFLDHWSAALPDARWIFVYRDPAHAAWSMSLRRTANDAAPDPWSRVKLALRIWDVYNRKILAFAKRSHEQCLLLRAPDDFGEEGADALGEVVRERWGLELGRFSYRGVFRPHLMKRRAPRYVRALARPHRRLFADLEALRRRLWERHRGGAGPPAPIDDDGPPKGPPVVGFAIKKEFEYTQTFVHNHIMLLPADFRVVITDRNRSRIDDGFPLLTIPERIGWALLSAFRIDPDSLNVRALRRHFRRTRIRAVLAEFGTSGVEVAEACRAEKIPLVVHFHGYDAYADKMLDLYKDRYPAMFESAASVVAVSRDMVEQLVRIGAPREKIILVPCGVDPAVFSGADPASAAPRLLSVGRFVDKKAPYLTLLAFREAVAERPEIRLTMMGDGPLRESSISLARALEIEEKVEFVGAHSHAEVVTEMKRVRAFVQHSRTIGSGDSEGTPVAIVEAGASGLPVISSRHAGIKDAVVHGETGFLVNEGDFTTMGRHMAMLAADPELARSMGVRARAHVIENYSMDKMIARLWSVVESAMAGKATR